MLQCAIFNFFKKSKTGAASPFLALWAGAKPAKALLGRSLLRRAARASKMSENLLQWASLWLLSTFTKLCYSAAPTWEPCMEAWGLR